MGALVTFLGSLFAGAITGLSRLISVETLKFLAWRALLMFALFVALPLVLYNTLINLVFDFMTYAMSFLSNQDLNPYIFEITGIGAYIASKIQLVQAFALFMSFVSIRFLMRFIPFFR